MHALKIFGFTILVTAFYWYVGQMVPQKESYPPETAEFSADMTTDELVAVGEEIVAGKGTCLSCHTVGDAGSALRFPDLGGIGAAAETRRDGMSGVDYLAEALYEPNVFIVEGFQAGMPTINKAPIGLTDDEIKAVIAYLQSLGGTPTVTLATALPYKTEAGAAPAAQPAALASGPAMDGPALFQAYLCGTCHSLEGQRLVGPPLDDVGARLSRSEIYEALLDPDATVAEGYPGGVMAATLGATGFKDKVSAGQLQTLVDYLAAMGGE